MQPEDYMEMALAEARQAELMDEVPIGAIVVYHGKVIGAGHNMRERFQNAAYHAELLAIMEACEYLGSWRLEECDLYVTLEPCMMCSGAIMNSRIRTLYYGAKNPKAGTVESLYHLLSDSRFNHQVEIRSGSKKTSVSSCSNNFLNGFAKHVKPPENQLSKRINRRLAFSFKIV